MGSYECRSFRENCRGLDEECDKLRSVFGLVCSLGRLFLWKNLGNHRHWWKKQILYYDRGMVLSSALARQC